jgi:hypothetical protein
MRFLATILASIFAAFSIGAYLTIPANPEVKFWSELVKHREVEIARIRKSQPNTPIIFFTGGSSTAFSIDPKIIEDICDIPAYNLGLPIAAEGKYLLHQALMQTQAGDILVVSLEQGLLTHYSENNKPSKLGFALSASAGQPAEASGGGTFGMSPSISDYLNFSRPGATYLSTLAARVVIRKGYRYTPDDLRYRGRLETKIHDPNMHAAGKSNMPHLSLDGNRLLTAFRDAANRRNVRVVYAIPWFYTTTKSIVECRNEKNTLLNDISTIMPTIDDGNLGCVDQPNWFSDTPQHLSKEGSLIRSRAIANTLKVWLAQ